MDYVSRLADFRQCDTNQHKGSKAPEHKLHNSAAVT